MSKFEKIVLSSSRDIPFNKLILSKANVRRVKAGVSIEELAEDIARRTLLTSITVRPVIDADGNETGMFEIPAGGRRFRALELLVRQKRLNKTAPVPCVIREDGTPEEDSLAENVQRAPLHPLDQFRAFLALREKGQSEEEIAAAFFVSVAVVKQRLKLASVSPKLLDVYAEDGMTLDQLMAFTVNGDHERQEQVFEQLSQSYSKEPYAIRRMLTEGAVRACDKRVQFVGLDAYVEAGGTILRDLFQGDDGGWLQDAGLVDMLVSEKLREAVEPVQAEGWKWIDAAPEFPYGHIYGLRRLRGEQVPLTDEEQATRDALQAELDGLEQQYAEADELPDEVDARLGEIETALAGFDDRPMAYDADEVARAGGFVSIDGAGNLRIERGYVRPEDEKPVEAEPASDAPDSVADGADKAVVVQGDAEVDADPVEPDEEDGLTPISERLMTELTAHRTLALRRALGDNPEVAFLAALHALCLKLFYHYAQDTCLDLDVKCAGFGAQAPGLADSALADEVDQRHQDWASDLPKQPEDLWDTLAGFDIDSRQALFAHCVAQSVNAIYEPYNRRPRALAHADRLAETLDLDMAAAGWEPTVDSWLGRVTKARILATVSEAKGDQAAERIAHLKKGEMAEQAQSLLVGSGWLPEPLRTPGRDVVTAVDEPVTAGTDGEPSDAADQDDAATVDEADGEIDADIEPDFEEHAIAAE